jgi:hypothetical protein
MIFGADGASWAKMSEPKWKVFDSIEKEITS